MFRSFLKRLTKRPPIRVSVDLTRLGHGGQNGGIKPLVFEFLQWIAAERGSEFTFIYFTKSSLVPEVEAFRRDSDWQVCVGESDGMPAPKAKAARAGLVSAPEPGADWRLRWPADLLYAPLGMSALVQPGLPWISLIVDTLHRDVPGILSPAETAYRDEWIRDGIANADAVQCISHFVSGQLQRNFSAPSAKIFVTHCVVNARMRAAANSVPKDSSSALPYFFYPANDWPHKNHRALLEAYAAYRREAAAGAWDLVLSGHFTQPEVWKDLIASLRLTASCRVLGHVEPQKFAEVFRGAGALVFPSLYEGFGIPVLEAMTLGVPVACSRSGSLSEVAGEAALFFDASSPADITRALREISADAGLQKRLVAAGRRRAEDFAIAKEAGPLADRFAALGRRNR